jgi:hypothetical protein
VIDLKTKRLLGLTTTVALTFSLALGQIAFAEQPSDTGTGTVNSNPDIYVDTVITDDTISFGTLNISQQGLANPRTDGSTEYAIFESQKDLGSPDSITLDEGATNSNSFYKVTYTGETFPSSGGLDNTDWLFLSNSTGTGYIESNITGTLTNNGGSVTMPVGVTEVGSFSDELIYYTSSNEGTTWNRATKTIYVALGDNGRLYVGDTADLTSSDYLEAKGSSVDNAFFGNDMVLSSEFPTIANDSVSLDFGWYIPWDSTQGNSDKSFYTLIDMPKHAATGHDWTWNLTINGEYHSNPQ